MTIRCVYTAAPNFPPTDQHPDAARYQVGAWLVDATGPVPTEAEVQAFLTPPAMTAQQKLDAFLAANPDVAALLG